VIADLKTVINASIGLARRIVRRDWLNASQTLLDLWEGNDAALTFIDLWLAAYYQGAVNRAVVGQLYPYINLLRAVVQERSRVYARQPSRTLTARPSGAAAPEAAGLAFAEAVRASKLGPALRRAEQYNELLGCAVLHPACDARRRAFRWQVLPAAELIVAQDEIDPLDVQACRWVMVPFGGNPDSVYSRPQTLKYLRYERTGEFVGLSIVREDGSPASDVDEAAAAWVERFNLGGARRIPVVLCQTEEPQEGSGMFHALRWDLLSAQLWQVWRLAVLTARLKVKEFEPYKHGGSKEDWTANNANTPEISSSSVIHTGGADLDVLQWSPQAEQFQAIEAEFRRALGQSLNLPRAFTERVFADSGVALHYHELPAERYRASVEPYWQRLEETDLWPVFAQTARLVDFDGAADLERYPLKVAFPEAAGNLSPAEELQLLKDRVDAGLTSVARHFQQKYGLSPKEAEALAAQIAGENKAAAAPAAPAAEGEG